MTMLDYKYWINISSFVFSIYINFLSSTGKIQEGSSIGEVSKAFPTLFTPAVYTFQIWFVIYSMEFVYVFLSPFMSGKKDIEKLFVLYNIKNVFNTLWLFVFTFSNKNYKLLVVSQVFIVLLWISFVIILNRIEKFNLGRLTQLYFSINFGWITAATNANLVVTLQHQLMIGYNPEHLALGVILLTNIIVLTTLNFLNKKLEVLGSGQCFLLVG